MEVVFRWKAGRTFALALVLVTLTDAGWSQQMMVQPGEQSVRDDERLRILEAELLELQRRADLAVRQRAERIAAHDAAAAEEAEQAHARALADIEALQREIATVGSPASPVKTVLTARAAPRRESAWWDVYAKAPGRGRGGALAAP